MKTRTALILASVFVIGLSACMSPTEDSALRISAMPGGDGSLVHVEEGNRIVFLERGASTSARSHDGLRLAFVLNDELWVINLDGTELRQVTDNEIVERDPVWSPDDTWIAFGGGDGPDDVDVYVVNVADEAAVAQRMTNTPGIEYGVSWAPDGSEIAFFEDGEVFAAVVHERGGQVRQLTGTDQVDPTPVWSPDGSKIAFLGLADDLQEEIFVMDSDGTNLIQLTDNDVTETEITWFPDGKMIAFVQTIDRYDPAIKDFTKEIFVINVDGTHLRLKTDNDLIERVLRFDERDDGLWLSFCCVEEGVRGEMLLLGETDPGDSADDSDDGFFDDDTDDGDMTMPTTTLAPVTTTTVAEGEG